MPSGKVKEVAEMLKAIHAQEELEAARGKAFAVVAKLRGMILGKPAEAVESGVEETLCYMCFLRGSLAQPAHQQSARKGHPGDPAADASGGFVPRRQQRADAGGRASETYRRG